MGKDDFPCPKCSQLNTTNQTICKNCGADLTQALDNIKHIEKVTGKRYSRIIDIIILVVILGVIAIIAIPKFIPLGPKRGSSAYGMFASRSVGSALSSTIAAKHSNWLLNGMDYTASDVVADTQYSGGITATTGIPGHEQISAISSTKIRFNYKNLFYEWEFIPRKGDTAASLRETGDN